MFIDCIKYEGTLQYSQGLPITPADLHAINTVADPGFPVGGRRPRRGGANSRDGYVSKNLYVKMKESGP